MEDSVSAFKAYLHRAVRRASVRGASFYSAKNSPSIDCAGKDYCTPLATTTQ